MEKLSQTASLFGDLLRTNVIVEYYITSIAAIPGIIAITIPGTRAIPDTPPP